MIGVFLMSMASQLLEHSFMDSAPECESAEDFRLEIAYADLPVSCGISLSLSGKFQSLPLSVKIQDAIEFGKFFKFVLRCHDTTASICFVNI